MFGIGCDPDSELAVNRLLKIKNRNIKKGLIIIAANLEQLKPYIDDSSLTPEQWEFVFSVWPGPVTLIFPTKLSTPCWLTGQFNSLAVRITNHPLVTKLCYAFGKPLVSTSANLTGLPPCRTILEVREYFGNTLSVIDGKTDYRLNHSEIRDVLTGKYLRKA